MRSARRPRGSKKASPRVSGLHWIAIRVELIEGRGQRFAPPPGRVFAASTDHSFADLAHAIDAGFARWDESHLHEFNFEGGARIGMIVDDDDVDDDLIDDTTVKLSRLKPRENFIYIFDLGDQWGHLCTVGTSAIDPRKVLGLVPETPQPFFGWGAIPDQYGRDTSDREFD